MDAEFAGFFADKIDEVKPQGVAIIFSDNTGDVTKTMIAEGYDPEQFIVSSINCILETTFPDITVVDTDIVDTVTECEDSIAAVWLSTKYGAKNLYEDIRELVAHPNINEDTLIAVQFKISEKEQIDRSTINKYLNANYSDSRRFQTSKILNHKRGNTAFWVYKLEALSNKKLVKRAKTTRSSSEEEIEPELQQRLRALEEKLREIYSVIGKWD